MKSAYTLDCYEPLGVSIPDLGCIMLDVEFPDYVTAQIEPEWAYHSQNPNMTHVAGIPDEHHVTLLFGLMHNGNATRFAVDEVLDDWERPTTLPVVEVGSFPSPREDEPYRCIIFKPHAPSLLEAHQRLSLLPHVNTHAAYVPHITVGYVHERNADRAIRRLEQLVLEQQLTGAVTGLNYGDPANPDDEDYIGRRQA